MDEEIGRQPRADEPAILGEPAPLEPAAEVVARAPRVDAAAVDSTTGAAALRSKVAAGEPLDDDENAAALRIGLAVPLRHGAPLVGQSCPACDRQFAVGELVHVVKGEEGAFLVHVHDGRVAHAVADSPNEHEVLDPVRAAIGVDAHRDPGDETDFKQRVADEALERFHASVRRLPEVTSEHNPDAEAARPVDELGNAYDARYDDFREHDPFAGNKVRIPAVETRRVQDEVRSTGPLPPLGAGHAGFADNLASIEADLLDEDDLTRLERAVCQPGDLSGELEAYVSVDDVRSLVATCMYLADRADEAAKNMLGQAGPIFEAIMELALVAGLAELTAQQRQVIRAVVPGGAICMVVAKGPYAGELAAWADAKGIRKEEN